MSTVIELPPPAPIAATGMVISTEPGISVVDDFLDAAECRHLIGLGIDLRRARVASDAGGKISDGRTNSVRWIRHDHDDTVLSVVRRIADHVGIPHAFAEQLQLICYLKGQEYREHFDAFDATTVRGRKNLGRRGQRLVTVLCYLSTVEAGGATEFPRLGITVPARAGRMLVFHNCRPDTNRAHPGTLHRGNPVVRGEKWAFNLWFRERSEAVVGHVRTRSRAPAAGAIVDVVPYRPQHDDGIAELWTRLHSTDPDINLRYLRWRYAPPSAAAGAAPGTALFVALAGERVVATRGTTGIRFLVEGDSPATVLPHAGDTVVDRRFEGRRLVQRLTGRLLDEAGAGGLDPVIHSSASVHLRRLSLRSGWTLVGAWQTLVRPQQVRAVSGLATGAEALSAIDGDHGAPQPADGGVLTWSAKARAEEMASVAARPRGSALIRPARDTAFIRWRCANPLNKYRFLYLDGDDGLEGYLVLAGSRIRPGQGIAIVDHAATGALAESALLACAIAVCGGAAIAMAPGRFGHKVSTILRDAGFANPCAGEGSETALLARFSRDDVRTRWDAAGLLQAGRWDTRLLAAL